MQVDLGKSWEISDLRLAAMKIRTTWLNAIALATLMSLSDAAWAQHGGEGGDRGGSRGGDRGGGDSRGGDRGSDRGGSARRSDDGRPDDGWSDDGWSRFWWWRL